MNDFSALINPANASTEHFGVPHQAWIDVYENGLGDIVISQESPDECLFDHNPFITVRPENVETLIEALRSAVKAMNERAE